MDKSAHKTEHSKEIKFNGLHDGSNSTGQEERLISVPELLGCPDEKYWHYMIAGHRAFALEASV
ncbi:hypothetical protein [Rhizobium sp. 9140]|uniref:hypothetical protein n=1 Tax=Rhizobium sp. 9140 TaxID=1761900 RepID=UPI000A923B12|nr:hypothetical protein [Rhizobium sp. 9140]